MDDIANEFLLPGSAEALRLPEGFIDADINVAKDERCSLDLRALVVVKGDYVGGTSVLQVLFVQSRHFHRIDDLDSEIEYLHLQQLAQAVQNDAPQQTQINPAAALTIPKRENGPPARGLLLLLGKNPRFTVQRFTIQRSAT